MRGYLYILTNTSLPGLVKIGFSTKDPSLRVADLSNTSVPTPFQLHYEVLIDNPFEVEQIVHRELKFRGMHEGKEFFRLSADEAVHHVRNFLELSKRQLYLEGVRSTSKCLQCDTWGLNEKCRSKQCVSDNSASTRYEDCQQLLQRKVPDVNRIDGSFRLFGDSTDAYIVVNPHWGPVVMAASSIQEGRHTYKRLLSGEIADIPQPGAGIAVAELNTVFFSMNTLVAYPRERFNGTLFPGQLAPRNEPKYDSERQVDDGATLYWGSSLYAYDVISLGAADTDILFDPVLSNPPQVLVITGGINAPDKPENLRRLKHLVLARFNLDQLNAISDWILKATNLQSLTYISCDDLNPEDLDFHNAVEQLSQVVFLDCFSEFSQDQSDGANPPITNTLRKIHSGLPGLTIHFDGCPVSGDFSKFSTQENDTKIYWSASV